MAGDSSSGRPCADSTGMILTFTPHEIRKVVVALSTYGDDFDDDQAHAIAERVIRDAELPPDFFEEPDTNP